MLTGAAHAAGAAKPGVDELLQFFDTVVFGSEIAGVQPRRAVWKWGQPFRVVIREYDERIATDGAGDQVRTLRQRRVKKRHFDFVQRHLSSLSRLTGIPTEEAGASRSRVNMVINFVPRFQMDNPKLANVDPRLLKRVAAHGGCYFLSWPDAETGNRIVKAVIVVNAELSMARKDHCVLEELTQSLGFPNDAPARWPSIFSDNRSVSNQDRVRALSRVDRIIIRTLYDRRMTPGMARAEALRAARTLIGEFDQKMP